MGVFQYKAIDSKGEHQSGSIEADNAKHVRQQLRANGLFPIEVETGNKLAGDFGVLKNRNIPKTFPRYKIPRRQLTIITRQIASLLEGGIPLEQAIQMVISQFDNKKIKNVLLTVASKIREGNSLADSMAEFPETFPDIYRAAVAAGEHAGYLDLALAQLADHYEISQRTSQKIQLALIYPIILSSISLLAVIFLLTYVMPNIARVFTDTNQKLPLVTTLMISLSDFLKNYVLLILLSMVVVGVIFYSSLKSRNFRYKFHKKLLLLPIIGQFLTDLSIANFIRTLGILIKNGVPLTDAIKISSKVIRNIYLKEKIEKAVTSINEGESLTKSLENIGNFPPVVLHMIASGESGGKLDDMLERAAKNQEYYLETKVSFFVGIFEPMMILAMGVIVLMFVLAILLPILNLNQVIK